MLDKIYVAENYEAFYDFKRKLKHTSQFSLLYILLATKMVN